MYFSYFEYHLCQRAQPPENGRWQIAAVSADGTETLCTIDAHTSYQLDSLSRTFRYAQDQMACYYDFRVLASEDDANLIFYLDSYFMIENRRWRQRRYVREVRTAKEKSKSAFSCMLRSL